jgi:hypothetical protein
VKQKLGKEIRVLFSQAQEIQKGKMRYFDQSPERLTFEQAQPLKHWTDYKGNRIDGRDIKFIWEPARFGWATVLSRAYYLGGEEDFAQTFWEYTESFFAHNPINMGPNWISGQEVAIRLMHLVFSYHLISESVHTTPERAERLAAAIAAHAERIPPTLAYARAQNNNHLLTEAAGLFTAGVVLPDHPRAGGWRKLGWRWFNRGLEQQISPDGVYVQHSTNYHRLMLQTALWVFAAAKSQGRSLPPESLSRLKAATLWLFSLVDRESGQTPNLGHNDGAYILPFTSLPFHDYRPILQAAGLAFLDETLLPAGPWDEMLLWFGLEKNGPSNSKRNGSKTEKSPLILKSPGQKSWAYLRAAHFDDRPAHADQLHFDLWWRGLNVARDAGTYSYNQNPPWDNALGTTFIHNTVTINDNDQMTRAGRFLWLDWAQAEILENDLEMKHFIARHDGYKNLGVLHQRNIEYANPGEWRIHDKIEATRSSARQVRARLHWLLPDWPWHIHQNLLELNSPHGTITLTIKANTANHTGLQLARAGEIVHGAGEALPVQGWISPNYGVKVPALSLSLEVDHHLPVEFISVWRLPD